MRDSIFAGSGDEIDRRSDGHGIDLGLAYAKSQMAAPPPLPKKGKVFISVKDTDKEAVIPVAREFVKLGFEIISTSGTAKALSKAKSKCKGLQDSRGTPKRSRPHQEWGHQLHHQHAERKKFPASMKWSFGMPRLPRRSRS